MQKCKFSLKCNLKLKKILSVIISISLVATPLPARAFSGSYLAVPGSADLSNVFIDFSSENISDPKVRIKGIQEPMYTPRGTFNPKAAVQYILELFRLDRQRKILPSMRDVAGALKVGRGTILNNQETIRALLEKRGGKRVKRAVGIERDIVGTMAEYILELFEKDPQRKVLPTKAELNKVFGTGRHRISSNFNALLKHLNRKGDERVKKAVALERDFVSIVTVYILELFENEPERKVLPAQAEIARVFGIGPKNIEPCFKKILDRLKRRGDERVKKAVAVEENFIDTITTYIIELFKQEPGRKLLPTKTEIEETFGIGERKLRTHFNAIVENLEKKRNKRITRAVAVYKSFPDAITAYIRELFKKERKRKVLPSLEDLGRIFGVKRAAIRYHWKVVLYLLDKEDDKRIKQAAALEKDFVRTVTQYILNLFEKEPGRERLPAKTELVEYFGVRYKKISSHFKAVVTRLKQEENKRIKRAVALYDLTDTVTKYIIELFKNEPARKRLPTNREIAKVFKLNETTLSPHFHKALNRLANEGNERVKRAVGIYRDLTGTLAQYILDLFKKEPKRKIFPAYTELANIFSLTRPTVADHFDEILNILDQKGNRRVKKAVEKHRGLIDKVVQYVLALFIQDVKKDILPTREEIARACRVQKDAVYSHWNTILDRLEAAGNDKVQRAVTRDKDLAGIVTQYILELFKQEPERKKLPHIKRLAAAVGIDFRRVVYRYDLILNDLVEQGDDRVIEAIALYYSKKQAANKLSRQLKSYGVNNSHAHAVDILEILVKEKKWLLAAKLVVRMEKTLANNINNRLILIKMDDAKRALIIAGKEALLRVFMRSEKKAASWFDNPIYKRYAAWLETPLVFFLGGLFIPGGFQIIAPLVIALSFWLPHLIGNRRDSLSLPVLGMTAATYGIAVYITALGFMHPVSILAVAGLTLLHLIVNSDWGQVENWLLYGSLGLTHFNNWRSLAAAASFIYAVIQWCIFIGQPGLGLSVILSGFMLNRFLNQEALIQAALQDVGDASMPDTRAMHGYGSDYIEHYDPDGDFSDELLVDDTADVEGDEYATTDAASSKEKEVLEWLEQNGAGLDAGREPKKRVQFAEELSPDEYWRALSSQLQKTDYFKNLDKKGLYGPITSSNQSLYSRMSHFLRVSAVARVLADAWVDVWNKSDKLSFDSMLIRLDTDKIRFFCIAMEIAAPPFFHHEWGVGNESLEASLFNIYANAYTIISNKLPGLFNGKGVPNEMQSMLQEISLMLDQDIENCSPDLKVAIAAHVIIQAIENIILAEKRGLMHFSESIDICRKFDDLFNTDVMNSLKELSDEEIDRYILLLAQRFILSSFITEKDRDILKTPLFKELLNINEDACRIISNNIPKKYETARLKEDLALIVENITRARGNGEDLMLTLLQLSDQDILDRSEKLRKIQRAELQRLQMINNVKKRRLERKQQHRMTFASIGDKLGISPQLAWLYQYSGNIKSYIKELQQSLDEKTVKARVAEKLKDECSDLITLFAIVRTSHVQRKLGLNNIQFPFIPYHMRDINESNIVKMLEHFEVFLSILEYTCIDNRGSFESLFNVSFNEDISLSGNLKAMFKFNLILKRELGKNKKVKDSPAHMKLITHRALSEQTNQVSISIFEKLEKYDLTIPVTLRSITPAMDALNSDIFDYHLVSGRQKDDSIFEFLMSPAPLGYARRIEMEVENINSKREDGRLKVDNIRRMSLYAFADKYIFNKRSGRMMENQVEKKAFDVFRHDLRMLRKRGRPTELLLQKMKEDGIETDARYITAEALGYAVNRQGRFINDLEKDSSKSAIHDFMNIFRIVYMLAQKQYFILDDVPDNVEDRYAAVIRLLFDVSSPERTKAVLQRIQHGTSYEINGRQIKVGPNMSLSDAVAIALPPDGKENTLVKGEKAFTLFIDNLGRLKVHRVLLAAKIHSAKGTLDNIMYGANSMPIMRVHNIILSVAQITGISFEDALDELLPHPLQRINVSRECSREALTSE